MAWRSSGTNNTEMVDKLKRKNTCHMPRWTFWWTCTHVAALACKWIERVLILPTAWEQPQECGPAHIMWAKLVCLSFNIGAELSVASTSSPRNKGLILTHQEAHSFWKCIHQCITIPELSLGRAVTTGISATIVKIRTSPQSPLTDMHDAFAASFALMRLMI